MPANLAIRKTLVCPDWLRSLSVTATDALTFDGGLQLKNPSGGFVAVSNTQFATGAVAIGVDRADTDLQLTCDLF